MTKKQTPSSTKSQTEQDPFGTFFQNQSAQQSQQLFGTASEINQGQQGVQLCFDLYQEGDRIVIEIPAPRLNPNALQVLHEDRCLRIRGIISPRWEEGKSGAQTPRTYFFAEVPNGAFDQLIFLPCEVDPNAGRATFSEGILKIELQKVHSETEIPVNWAK